MCSVLRVVVLLLSVPSCFAYLSCSSSFFFALHAPSCSFFLLENEAFILSEESGSKNEAVKKRSKKRRKFDYMTEIGPD